MMDRAEAWNTVMTAEPGELDLEIPARMGGTLPAWSPLP